MNKYSKGFYTLMGEAGIRTSESFTAYLNDVIGFGNLNDLNVDGFEWDPVSQIEFDYEQMQLNNRIKVMATYADKDSEVIPFGTEGFNSTRGVIPRQKARYLMDEDDYRKYLATVKSLDMQNMTAREYALNLLFNSLDDIKNAHFTSMTYQRDQMISNRMLELDANNNPRGIKGLKFEADVPDGNVTTLKNDYRWFTNEEKTSEGAAADPVGDIRKIVRAMKRKGYIDITLEVDEVSWMEDMDHSKWQIAIGYALTPSLLMTASNDTNAQKVGANATDDERKAAFKKIIGVSNVKYRQGLVGVEKLNSSTKKLERVPFRSFKANTYVFYPSGNLGTIKSVLPLLPDNEALYGSFLSGKGIIQYEYNAKAKSQDWWSELTALCVPYRVAEMFYLYTK